MATDQAQDELDDDGLVVQKYPTSVLVIVPPHGFGDQSLRYARSCLHNVHVGTKSVSTLSEEMVTGRLQDEFLVDAAVDDVDMADYAGVLVVANDGPSLLSQEARVLQLVRDAAEAGKLVAGWGNALEVLARAGVVKGKRVTGDPEAKELAVQNGAKYTGRQIEVSNNFVTARDEGAGMRFGQALAEIVRI